MTIQTLVGSAEKAKASTQAMENLELVPTKRTSPPLKITIITMMKKWMNLQTPIKPTMTQLTLEVMTEKKLWTMMMTRENDTFSSHVALDDVTIFEAAELDAIALLADTWNDDLVHNWYKRAHKLTFPSERKKAKVKVKPKARARADILFARHACQCTTVDDD